MKFDFKGDGTAKSPKKIKNIYARGADDGFWLGLYFSVLFGLAVASLQVPVLNIFAGTMALGVPFLTYFFLRRTHVAAHGMTVFSALWMQGITMFACGSLIFGTLSFVYLRWIDPGFLARVLQAGVDYYSASPAESSQMLASEFQMLLDSKMMPSALNVAFGWMWLGMFSGSVLSMLVAALVKLKKVKI
ncbi:MAG: DUF4199 domain-containing protein [Muribaculaceae bacterium]|nr:DUF4199 domain-containing protein [Muribaculaceae bacterium]